MDNNAIKLKLDSYLGLIYYLAFQYNAPKNTMEDILSIGKESILNALQTYDSNKGAEKSWVYFYIRKSIQNYLSSERIKGVKASRQTANKYSINANNDVPEIIENIYNKSPVEILNEQEDILEINRKYILTINKLNRKVSSKTIRIFLSYYRAEKSMKEIAEEEKLSIGNISERLKTCREIIKKG